MSKPNEPRRDRAQHGRTYLAVIGVVSVVALSAVLNLPLGAKAGLAADDGGGRVPPPAAAKSKGSGTYQLRCWQYGRLLFDEGPVTLGNEARQSARLVVTDRHGGSLIVTDTGGTTCLARPWAAAPNPALPR